MKKMRENESGKMNAYHSSSKRPIRNATGWNDQHQLQYPTSFTVFHPRDQRKAYIVPKIGKEAILHYFNRRVASGARTGGGPPGE
ncbi:MAG: hypothetical protein ACE5OZ_22805 [Candidatus Heimdallarchaeota archaeon]